ncbi:MAG: polysaccharide biosynthesis/export family protein [Gemmatimonadetes bacterium]|nr:polysaccharide biosynthesis/export family protein [Gemmatimonadota bacterium]
MSRLGVLLTLVAAVGVVLIAPAARAQQAGEASTRSHLQPGDQIRVRLWQEPQLSGDYPVDETGHVSLPLLGMRQVTREPADEVKRTLMQEYDRQLRNQPAQITLLHRIRILGAVPNPGLYHVDPTMTLGDAIALAGGIEDDGDEDGIRVRRDGRAHPVRLDRGSEMTAIRSGDEVFVPRRAWVSRNATFILGAVISATALILSR